MIVAAAFCPHPPVLVPEVARGAALELDELRAACRTAITRIALPGRLLAVVGSGPRSRTHLPTAAGSLGGFGVPIELGFDLGSDTPIELPLSLTVGAWLVQEAIGPESRARAYSVGPDWATSGADDLAQLSAGTTDVALLVMGDGTARRSTAAPGYLDERAEAFDASVARALAGGDSSALAALDGDLGRDLLAAGVPAWHAASGPLGATSWSADLLYDAAPYGVGYFVATWT